MLLLWRFSTTYSYVVRGIPADLSIFTGSSDESRTEDGAWLVWTPESVPLHAYFQYRSAKKSLENLFEDCAIYFFDREKRQSVQPRICTCRFFPGRSNIRAMRYPSGGTVFPQTGQLLRNLSSMYGWQCGHPKIWQMRSLSPGKTADLICSPDESPEEQSGHRPVAGFFFCLAAFRRAGATEKIP